MSLHFRLTWLLAAIITVAYLAGCRPNGHRSTGEIEFGVGQTFPPGTPEAEKTGSSWFRKVKYSVDGNGSIIARQRTSAAVVFSRGEIVIEKARVLLNDKELAKISEDAKLVEVGYASGTLTINADGEKVYSSELGK